MIIKTFSVYWLLFVLATSTYSRDSTLFVDGIPFGLYMPNKQKPKPILLIWFHGGMYSTRTDKGVGGYHAILSALDSTRFWILCPSANRSFPWNDPKWPSLIKQAERQLNKKFHQVWLAGVSDGALGVQAASNTYLDAKRYICISGYMEPLLPANQITPIADGGVRWWLLNGGADHLYPSTVIEPYHNAWKKLRPLSHVYDIPGVDHDLQEWKTKAPLLLKQAFAAP